MGKQGQGRRLTDKERMEIIVLTRENPRIKHVELAAKYNVNESTIRKWRGQGNAAKIEERYKQGVAASRDHRQRGQAVRNTQFDAELYEWVSSTMKQDGDLAPVRVREKARAMAALHDGMDGFKASSGWYYRFCRRYGLPCGPAGRDGNIRMQIEGVTADAMDVDAALDFTPQDPPGSSVQEDTATPEALSGPLQLPVGSTTDLDVDAQKDDLDMPSTESELLLSLGEMTSAATAAATASSGAMISSSAAVLAPSGIPQPAAGVITSALTTASMPVMTMPVISMYTPSQAAVSHMSHHFKDVLDPQARLRLVRHLSRVPGEADMYLVMDDETRAEYVKEFAAVAGDNQVV